MNDVAFWIAIAWFAPFVGVMILAACKPWISRKTQQSIALTTSVCSCLASAPIFWVHGVQTTAPAEQLYPWISLNGLPELHVGWMIDRTGAQMLFLVTLLSLVVNLFSLRYLRDEPDIRRYFAALSLFSFSMLTLVLSPTLLQSFTAWEGVGLSSWLLIGFWTKKREAASGALRAFLYNRLGDVLLLGGLLMLLLFAGTDQISVLTTGNFHGDIGSWLWIAAAAIVVGASAKSAQFPFIIWLPGAMSGPTPVSALLHAATMVAAGVFLLVRLFPALPETVWPIITALGMLSALAGALLALFAQDIKKVLAGSTASQLGIMFLALGTGFPELAFFHLLTHAFFKCGLFLSAASITDTLHSHEKHVKIDTYDPYNMKYMGGLRKHMPFVFVVYVVFAAALIGLPLTSGYLSKDALIDALLFASQDSYFGILPGIIVLATSVLTAFYTFRQGWLIFGGSFRGSQWVELPKKVRVSQLYFWPLALLAAGSVAVALSPMNPFQPILSWTWDTQHMRPELLQHLSPTLMTSILAITAATLGTSLAYIIYRKKDILADPVETSWAYAFSNDRKWVALYSILLEKPVLQLANLCSTIDETIINMWIIGTAVKGVAGTSFSIAKLARTVDNDVIDGSIYFITGSLKSISKTFSRLHGGSINQFTGWSLVLWLILLIVLLRWFAIQ